MNEVKHTPGPWKIAKDNYGVERIWDADLACDIACCEGDGSIEREVRQANTRLIAAAPEMLEALETLFDITPFATNDKDAKIRLRVRKVIRKAKGE